MKPESGKSLSIWASGFDIPKFESLNSNLNTDVCIVGAGITGLTTAYLLAQQNKKVVVLDDGNIGGGETSRTTAHITSVIDDRYSEIERLHGEKAARLAADSQIAAINMIEKIVLQEKIECDFKRVNGYLLFKPEDTEHAKEIEACTNAGVMVEYSEPVLKGFDRYTWLKFPNQAEFHVLKYLSGLAQSIIKKGGKIFTHSFVKEIKDGKNVCVHVQNGKTVTAKKVVVATNSPISDYKAVHTKQTAFRTYVIGVEIKKDSIERALYWDNENPYHYIRVVPEENHDILLVGGEDHITGQEDELKEKFVNLEKWAKSYFDNLGAVKFQWSGQVLEPVDGLSFIGNDPENPKNVFIATGDSGMGITHGTFAAIINSDLIIKGRSKWAKLYDPKRITLKSLPEFLKSGVNFASQYLDFLTPGEVNNEEKIPKGEGAIMREGLDKFAVYKDTNGKIHKYSALCTHLKCILKWNNVEKSWDCPCHGSRYNAYGKVLNGPAITRMKKENNA